MFSDLANNSITFFYEREVYKNFTLSLGADGED